MTVIQRILAPTDLDERSDTGLRYAAALAADTGAQLYIVHVATSLTAGGRAAEPAAGSGDAESRAHARLAVQVSRTVDGVEAHTEVLFGDPVYATIGYARSHEVDLVVITLANRSRVGKLLMGSHAQSLMLASDVPVLGVPIAFGSER